MRRPPLSLAICSIILSLVIILLVLLRTCRSSSDIEQETNKEILAEQTDNLMISTDTLATEKPLKKPQKKSNRNKVTHKRRSLLDEKIPSTNHEYPEQ